jgi:hypothetical protein
MNKEKKFLNYNRRKKERRYLLKRIEKEQSEREKEAIFCKKERVMR